MPARRIAVLVALAAGCGGRSADYDDHRSTESGAGSPGSSTAGRRIPRGCACLKNPLNGDELTWFCGSTRRWFSPE